MDALINRVEASGLSTLVIIFLVSVPAQRR